MAKSSLAYDACIVSKEAAHNKKKKKKKKKIITIKHTTNLGKDFRGLLVRLLLDERNHVAQLLLNVGLIHL
jgi:hypothetical protein